MFTGIVQGVATVEHIEDRTGLRTLSLRFPAGFGTDLALGASVACDGVCLTVTEILGPDAARFDVMQQTLQVTALGGLQAGQKINVERAAREGAEIGGHPISGHVDACATVLEVRHPENNHVLRLGLPREILRYVFAKGYIGVNGASLTIAEVDRAQGWFEVWLIPETLRMTTFGDKRVGDRIHIEVERSTQVMVDTVREAVDERLGALLPGLRTLLAERGLLPPDAA